MNKIISAALVAAMIVALAACSKKKESTTIITTIEKVEVKNEIQTIQCHDILQSFEWGGAVYEVQTQSLADKNLGIVKDDDGNRYYQNSITLTVDGPSGNVFKRTFTKSDFESYINLNYLKPSRCALMSIAFSRVEGAEARFMVTVGSPNPMDDEYMLVQLALSKNGAMSLSKVEGDE